VSKINLSAEAEQMLMHYLTALSIYHKTVLLVVSLADSLTYNDALELKQRAFRMLARARGDYWDHVSRHGFPARRTRY
jgi:hypothetical protein